ncbi:E3 ubiquitin-protein ligase RNF138 isoform X4 [Pithys albifrons albifrons]|uniref:E3 ubiquitin-protein ligase RNF138 isoform X4 n=1 Tax=Pithys albifrons albifrons TaxID=3385563 RepID=UPI003A5D1644
MAEGPAAAPSCFREDDFYCPVCQEVFKTPVRTANCRHVFCRKCFLTAIRQSGTHCPLCRGSVTKKERTYPKRALDVENSMKKASGVCKYCETQVRFSWMRQHYKTCKKYQDEYGVSSIIPNLQISQDSTGNRQKKTFLHDGFGMSSRDSPKIAGVMQYLIMARWLIVKYFKEKLVDIQPSNAPCVRKPILPDNACWITVIIDILFRRFL